MDSDEGFQSNNSYDANTVDSISVPGLIPDSSIQYIYTYIVIGCGSIALFGIATNVINIFVFIKMKFKETINIAFMGLAVSDLFSLLSLLWVSICYNPAFMYSSLNFLTVEIQFKTGGWTHIVFTRVTTMITVYITLERCLCIAFPLKIKQFLTPKRVFLVIVGIYVVVIGSLSCNWANFEFAWKWVQKQNKTMYGLVFKDNRAITQSIVYYFNVVYITIAFVSVTICSAILIWKLMSRSKFLITVTGAGAATDQEKSRSNRDNQVIRMVVTVAAIFIGSFTPYVMFVFAMALEPEFNMGKRFQNTFVMMTAVTYTCNGLNAGVNIFVYYNMSSKYASNFRSLFGKSGDLKK